MTLVRRCFGPLALALVWATSLPVHAVLIGVGDGTQNTTQPPGVSSWLNVGRIGTASGVYIGNGWVLTAAHVDPGTNHAITFFPSDNFPNGAVTYQLDPSTTIGLHNTNDNSTTDLVMIRTTTDPGLPALTIPGTSPAASTPITLAGFGANRGAAVRYDANWNEVPSGGTYSGFKFNPNSVFQSNGYAKRWGTSSTSNFPGGGTVELAAVNSFQTKVFTAAFQTPASPSDNTAIGVSGDSGGAVFSSASPNTLLGILLYQDSLNVPPGQPYDANNNIGTAIFGNGTDAADLATYAAQINAIIPTPEPSTALLLTGILGILSARRRRRRCAP